MTQATNDTTKRYVPELDGLRGVATTLVFIHHLNLIGSLCGHSRWAAFIHAGWMGVDLFFVPSGFLITQRLLHTKGQPGYMRKYGVDRARRILPLYMVFFGTMSMLYLVSGGAWAVVVNGHQSPLTTMTLLQNWLNGLGYEGTLVTDISWSVALEVQFYSLWLLVMAKCSRKQVAGVAVGLLLLSPVIRVFAHEYVGSKAPYYWTVCRLDGLMLGALTALATTSTTDIAKNFRKYAGKFAPVPLAILLMAIPYGFAGHRTTSVAFYSFGYSYIAVCATCVFVAAHDNTWPVLSKILRARPLVYLGKVSYGLYLLHMTVIVITLALVERVIGSPQESLIATVAYVTLATTLTVAAASFSWRYIEEPALRRKV